MDLTMSQQAQELCTKTTNKLTLETTLNVSSTPTMTISQQTNSLITPSATSEDAPATNLVKPPPNCYQQYKTTKINQLNPLTLFPSHYPQDPRGPYPRMSIISTKGPYPRRSTISIKGPYPGISLMTNTPKTIHKSNLLHPLSITKFLPDLIDLEEKSLHPDGCTPNPQ